MRDLFRGYYKPTSEEFAQIWKKCVFSFDANVLLHKLRNDLVIKSLQVTKMRRNLSPRIMEMLFFGFN